MTTGSPDGELLFKANGQTIAGWTDVFITRGVERMPSDFHIGGTVKFPGEMRNLVPINSPMQLSIGGHVVLTGFLERVSTRIAPEQHDVTFVGRGRLCDIADCAALLNNMTRQSTSVAALASELVVPFAKNHPVGPIQILTPNGEGNAKLYTFNVNLGESPYDIIARVARYEGLLAYENESGNLVLSRVGTVKHASGFVESENVQTAEFYQGVDDQFSVYIPLMISTDTLTRDGSVATANAAGKRITDPSITRYRPRIVVSEQMVNDDHLAEQRALWEATRRAGMSLRVTVECDSWLDAAGVPWTPNMLAPIGMRSSGIEQDWIISQVTYRRNSRQGTTALVTLVPPEALSVEPSALNALQARSITPSANNETGEPTTPTPAPTAPNASKPTVNLGEDFGL